MDWGAALVTFTVAEVVIPPTLAEIEAIPAPLATTDPDDVTAAMEESLVTHLASDVWSVDVPSEKAPETAN